MYDMTAGGKDRFDQIGTCVDHIFQLPSNPPSHPHFYLIYYFYHIVSYTNPPTHPLTHPSGNARILDPESQMIQNGRPVQYDAMFIDYMLPIINGKQGKDNCRGNDDDDDDDDGHDTSSPCVLLYYMSL